MRKFPPEPVYDGCQSRCWQHHIHRERKFRFYVTLKVRRLGSERIGCIERSLSVRQQCPAMLSQFGAPTILPE